MKKIALIDYGSGNIHSAFKALETVAHDNSEIKIVTTPEDLNTSTHIVLPGVGAFADCYKGVTSINGMLETLQENIITKKKNFLGICVGMQLLADVGYENGTHKGFGFIQGEVKKFKHTEGLKIPHMGWNNISFRENETLFKNIPPESDFYFVHSYYFDCAEDNISATCDYGIKFAAAIKNNDNNIFGVQFHPEKSQKNGLKLLANFIAL